MADNDTGSMPQTEPHPPPGGDNDTGSMPGTEPHSAPIFDTGPHPQPLEPSATTESADTESSSPIPAAEGQSGHQRAMTSFESASRSEPRSESPAQSVVVPGQYHFLPWWKLVLAVLAVWVPAALIGVGLFSWWYSLTDKTPAVFVVLVYVVACTVGALMLAMVQTKPLVSALAIATMTAVFASTAAAAPLYGHSYCQAHERHGGHCLLGFIPY